MLEGTSGLHQLLEFFDADMYGYGNNMTHRVPASLDWLFFPTSALVYTFEYANQQFANPDEILASPTLLSDNNRVSNMIGYNGAITERFSLTAMIGYARRVLQDRQRLRRRDRPRRRALAASADDRLSRRLRPRLRPSFIGNFVTIKPAATRSASSRCPAPSSSASRPGSRSTSRASRYSPDGTLLGTKPLETTRVSRRYFWRVPLQGLARIVWRRRLPGGLHRLPVPRTGTLCSTRPPTTRGLKHGLVFASSTDCELALAFASSACSKRGVQVTEVPPPATDDTTLGAG